ncbi:MerR family transcriptional regulator [Leuconostoc gelidum]|uniref:MerR family transcriptional regulator n=1 Tax=Leuconostoc gelidum TaxID=1244 RepID=UPI001C7CD18B|nr:MerR family transcriptional regulator [Leuconostoc gelidum]MBZ6010911.1 MerR family transcriptional regulator [Leuconostoc gelidum subsp. aenigmaticum]
MQTYSISELARIFKITKYTIRHYVDEQLLLPLKDEVSGYYIFSETDLYKLYQVITFRKIGYSIKSIKELLIQNDHANTFKIAEQKIQDQIDELVQIKHSIQEIIQAQTNTPLNEIYFCEKGNQFLKKIPANLLAEGHVNLSVATKNELVQLENVYYIINRNSSYVSYIVGQADNYDYKLASGTYACKDVLVKDEKSLDSQIQMFINDIFIQSRLLSGNGELFCYENIFKSLAYNEETVFTIGAEL